MSATVHVTYAAPVAPGTDQATLTIEGISIGIAKRDDYFLLAIGIDSEDFVQSFIAYI